MKINSLFTKKFFCRQTGFTITELLVVMFIVSLVATLSLVNYRSGQKKYVLTQTVQLLVSNIRKAQNMTLSGFGFVGTYYGYGVYIDENDSYYIIYGDIDGNAIYEPSDDIIETIFLPTGINIKSVSSPSDKLHIFFEPPQPTTYLNGVSAAGISETITLEIENSSLSKTVRVSTAGLVQVE